MTEPNFTTDGRTVTVRVPISIRRRGGRKLVLAPDGTNVTTAPVCRHIDNAMVKAIARGFRWREMLENGTHATILEDEVTIGHNVTLHGCHVERGCLIGIGSIVMDGVRVGERSLVAAGALVSPGTQIPPRSLVLETNMPNYPWLADRQLSESDIQARLRTLRLLGDPYTEAQIAAAPVAVRNKTELDALVAYLQGLGVLNVDRAAKAQP